MSLLYRSPNVVIDGYEWHIAVTSKSTRSIASVTFRFRPRGGRPVPWRPMSQWEGRKPVGIRAIFAPYLRHAEIAKKTVRAR